MPSRCRGTAAAPVSLPSRRRVASPPPWRSPPARPDPVTEALGLPLPGSRAEGEPSGLTPSSPPGARTCHDPSRRGTGPGGWGTIHPIMRGIGRLLLAGLVLLSLATPALPQFSTKPKPLPGTGGTAAPREQKPAEPETKSKLPTLRLGAVLPLTGPGAWFGKEIRQGMELAIADLNGSRPSAAADASPGEEEAIASTRQDAEEGLPSAGVTFMLETADVQPLDVKKAAD